VTERPGRTELGRALAASGALAPGWHAAFGAVDRARFLPGVMWPHDRDTGVARPVVRGEDPAAWFGAADADVPIVTQWDDGEHVGREPGRVFTSSSSMPSVVFGMLGDLDLAPGHRVLEIGTGTGWNAALLAHRAGAGRVVSVEVDPAVAASARAALGAEGADVHVVCADGVAGWAAGAPYDRVVATCGFRAVPFAWVEQAAPGGVILVPWGTYFGYEEAVARLTVHPDGRGASGRFTRPVAFMRARAQRAPHPEHRAYVAEGAGAERSRTALTEDDLLESPCHAAEFAVGLRVPECVQLPDRRQPDGSRAVWYYARGGDRSWAVAVFHPDRAEGRVFQSGARRLWDEVAAAYAWWDANGRPGQGRFGLTVVPEGHRAWLDDPANSWAVAVTSPSPGPPAGRAVRRVRRRVR
jgi:protein-L-isoaspartate O-methyltransferase